jgi:hypothetical protein
VVNAIAHIDIKPPRLTKERVVAGGAAAIAVTSGLLLGIRLRFHNHAPEQLAIGLALHQQAADQLGGYMLGGAGEKALGNGFTTRSTRCSPRGAAAIRLKSLMSSPRAAMHTSGFSLATVLIFGSGLFVLATLFFGTKGGYYDTDDYDGNGTAH